MPEKPYISKDEGKMFIGGLTYSTTDEMLRQYYSQWGTLIDYIVMKDPQTKRSRGFGFVTYEDPGCIDKALDNLPHVIDGKTVDPKRALPRDSQSTNAAKNESPPVKRLYVSGVRSDHTEECFRDYFSEFGKVVQVDMIADKVTGEKRGFAYITFDDADAVEKAIKTRSHMIDNKRCDVKKAMSRDEMMKTNQYNPQYNRDRMERDYRSRGSGRGDGYSNGNWGGYGGNYGGGGYGGGNWNNQRPPAQNWQGGGQNNWGPGPQANYAGGQPSGPPAGGGYGNYGGAAPAPAAPAPAYVGGYGPPSTPAGGPTSYQPANVAPAGGYSTGGNWGTPNQGWNAAPQNGAAPPGGNWGTPSAAPAPAPAGYGTPPGGATQTQWGQPTNQNSWQQPAIQGSWSGQNRAPPAGGWSTPSAAGRR